MKKIATMAVMVFLFAFTGCAERAARAQERAQEQEQARVQARRAEIEQSIVGSWVTFGGWGTGPTFVFNADGSMSGSSSGPTYTNWAISDDSFAIYLTTTRGQTLRFSLWHSAGGETMRFARGGIITYEFRRN